jgi:alpha-tubulin suppressor-like RCC1 family protein
MKTKYLNILGWTLCLIFYALFAENTHSQTSVVVWGSNNYGQTNVPARLTNVVAIANGGTFALALTANGSVVGWGDNDAGQTSIPTGLSSVTQIAVENEFVAGTGFSLAVENGTVLAWGDNQYGQCNVPYMTNAISILPNSLTALKSDGTMVEWGTYFPDFVPAGLSNVIAISEGGCQMALQSDGQVAAWGNPYYGLTNVPANLSNVVAIAAGATACLALSANGQLTMWGTVTNVPDGLTNVVAITAQPSGNSIDFFAAVTATGRVVAWGQIFLGDGDPQDLATNVPASITNAAQVFAQPFGALTLNRDSTVSGWGIDGYETDIPPGLTNVVAISGPMVLQGQIPPQALPMVDEFAYSGNTTILKANATGFPLNYQWQLNGVNIPGANQPWLMLTNVQTVTPFAKYTVIVSNAYGSSSNSIPLAVANSAPIILGQPQSLELPPNNNFTFSVQPTGSQPMSYQWQFNGTNIPGATGSSLTVTNAQLPAAGYYSVAVTNQYGGLVSSNAGLSFSITSVAVWGAISQGDVYSNLTDVLAIAAGTSQDLALLGDGSVVGWSDDGAMAIPSNVTNVVAIASGYNVNLALRADGSLVYWTDDNAFSGVLSGASNIVAITAGDVAVMALQSNGVVVAWSNVIWGGFYDPDINVTSVPASATNVVAIAATANNCLALRADGTVVQWGQIIPGQTNFVLPLTNIISLGSGSISTIGTAVKADGTVVVWNNDNSFLEPPAGLSNVVSVAAGTFFCLAMLANHTAVTWGEDFESDLEIPPGLTNVTQIGCGGSDGIVLDPAGGVITLVPSGTSLPGQGGYLQATLTPSAAVAAGAGWGIIGQPSFSSNTNFTVLVSAGQSVALAFQSITGWDVPVSRAVAVPLGGLTNINISYTVQPPVMSAIPGTGFGITGTTNTTYRLQYNTTLSGGQWLTLSTNTLGQGFNIIAPWPPTNHAPATYYRAVWLP